MQSKSIHEPFIRVVKRGEMPMKKKIAIRLFAVLLALVAVSYTHLRDAI